MGFNCGIVGLPNVGKSTLFNALTATQAAQSANYPFCTIEPNTGRVAVPDPRLDTIAKIGGSAKIIHTQLEFVDIAGLVKGASKGEGLGNQFLGNIRATDAILHVLRCFEDGDITHVEGSVDPVRDAETINTELMLADLDSLERQIENWRKRAKQKDKDALIKLPVMEKAIAVLAEGKPARALTGLDEEEQHILSGFQLLTAKPILYVCNVDEASAASGNAWTEKVSEMAAKEGASRVIISAGIESEVAQLPASDQSEFLTGMGLSEPGLNKVIRAGYSLLGLLTFFTVGPKEARAWTVFKGAKAPQAAGVIHSDFERGFIRAETMAYDDYVSLGGEAACRESGKLRQEGKEYLVQDGDIFHFKFNV